jgi:hypothetical protein
VAVGNEIVMFRHEKTFVHPTAIAIAFPDDEPLSGFRTTSRKHESTASSELEKLKLDLVLVDNFSEAVEPFVRLVRTVAGATGWGIIPGVRSGGDGSGATGTPGAAAVDPRCHPEKYRKRSARWRPLAPPSWRAGHARRTGIAHGETGRHGVKDIVLDS